MDCSSCGHKNPERAKFCLECGAGFALRCVDCATELPAGAKFCLECGTATGEPNPVAPARDPRDAGNRRLPYTPKHVADKILQSKSALEGKRKRGSPCPRRERAIRFG